MKRPGTMATALVMGAALFISVPCAFADRWDVRREIAEGNREIRRERREALREIASADSRWEARREIREAHREIRREQYEKRREVRREIRQDMWRW